MIISAGKMEKFPFATSIGIGLIDSAINLTRLALYQNPEFLLFVGSAGSYGKYNIGDIVESSSASNIELSFYDNNAYTPIDNVLEVKNINAISNNTIVNCSNYITTTTKYSDKMNTNNIGIENMEFYSVLKVAQEFNIPASGVFVVTNMCDKSAHNEFIANHKEAMSKLYKYLKKRNLF